MSAAARRIKKTLADAIRRQMAAERLNTSTFARKINTERNALRRILDEGNTSITLNTMVKTAEALDLELTLSVKRLPLSKIDRLVGRLAATRNTQRASALKRRIFTGYYGRDGRKADAQDSAIRSSARPVRTSA